MKELTPGLTGRAESIVNETNTALAMGSGSLRVFATPALAALMEAAACAALADALPEGQTSVGTALDLKHTAATPVGMRVWAEAVLTAIDRRALSFTITAYDERGEIGCAAHTRFLVDAEKFQQKADAKHE